MITIGITETGKYSKVARKALTKTAISAKDFGTESSQSGLLQIAGELTQAIGLASSIANVSYIPTVIIDFVPEKLQRRKKRIRRHSSENLPLRISLRTIKTKSYRKHLRRLYWKNRKNLSSIFPEDNLSESKDDVLSGRKNSKFLVSFSRTIGLEEEFGKNAINYAIPNSAFLCRLGNTPKPAGVDEIDQIDSNLLDIFNKMGYFIFNDNLKEILIEGVFKPWFNGTNFSKGIFIKGEYGSGKSTLARCVANYLSEYKPIVIGPGEFADPSGLTEVIGKIRERAELEYQSFGDHALRQVVVFDEMGDILTADLEHPPEKNVIDLSARQIKLCVRAFMSALDSGINKTNLMFIATMTNEEYKQIKSASALVRDGRFNLTIPINYPSGDEVRKILQYLFGLESYESESYEYYVDESRNCLDEVFPANEISFAEIKSIGNVMFPKKILDPTELTIDDITKWEENLVKINENGIKSWIKDLPAEDKFDFLLNPTVDLLKKKLEDAFKERHKYVKLFVNEGEHNGLGKKITQMAFRNLRLNRKRSIVCCYSSDFNAYKIREARKTPNAIIVVENPPNLSESQRELNKFSNPKFWCPIHNLSLCVIFIGKKGNDIEDRETVVDLDSEVFTEDNAVKLAKKLEIKLLSIKMDPDSSYSGRLLDNWSDNTGIQNLRSFFSDNFYATGIRVISMNFNSQGNLNANFFMINDLNYILSFNGSIGVVTSEIYRQILSIQNINDYKDEIERWGNDIVLIHPNGKHKNIGMVFKMIKIASQLETNSHPQIICEKTYLPEEKTDLEELFEYWTNGVDIADVKNLLFRNRPKDSQIIQNTLNKVFNVMKNSSIDLSEKENPFVVVERSQKT